MALATTKKPQRTQTSLVLSVPARGALRRIKTKHGITMKSAIHRGIELLETHLNSPQGRGI
jgi:hypothetical protein